MKIVQRRRRGEWPRDFAIVYSRDLFRARPERADFTDEATIKPPKFAP